MQFTLVIIVNKVRLCPVTEEPIKQIGNELDINLTELFCQTLPFYVRFLVILLQINSYLYTELCELQ